MIRIKECHVYFAIAAAALIATGIYGDADLKKTAMGFFLVAFGALWIGAHAWSEDR